MNRVFEWTQTIDIVVLCSDTLPHTCSLFRTTRSLSLSDTAVSDIEESFKNFTTRSDIAVVLINQNVSSMTSCDQSCDQHMTQVAEMIRHLLDAYDQPAPAILEVPSKDHPYDPSKDSILRRAKVDILSLSLSLSLSYSMPSLSQIYTNSLLSPQGMFNPDDFR